MKYTVQVKTFKIIAVLLIVTAIVLYHRQLLAMVRTWQPTLFGCEEIAESVFVQADMPSGQREKLLSDLAASRNRLSRLFDSFESSPKVIVCADEACFRRYGGVSAKGNAFGHYAIVLSPRRFSTVFLTHELFHAELAQRIGIWRLWMAADIPRWFDEGLAVYASEDPRHDRQSWCLGTNNGKDAPGLDELAKRHDWLTVNRRGGVYSYGTAREELSRWFEYAGTDALGKLIKRIKAGDEFLPVYTDLAGVADTFLPRAASALQANQYCPGHVAGTVE